ncbi:hypothetical protein ZWY2020_031038 [Hordeum vulgare]|nr:hypothetical protein ZWY2020_031038 [Hordeum vulgare]
MGKGGKGEAADGGEGENMAAWLVAKNTLKIMPFKLPPLGPYDVRVRMKAVGICGSDVHYLKEMRIAHFVVKEPMVIGHECAGIIEEVGGGVKHLAVGDRVALEPGISCWRCRHCKGGRYNLCDDMKFFATPPYHGSLADQIVHPGDLCFKLPDNVSLEEGAMCEPLSVGVHACRRADVGAEKKVLIMGAGPIGLVTMLSARAFERPGSSLPTSTTTACLSPSPRRGRHREGDAAGREGLPGGMGHNEMTVPLTSAAIREVDVVGIFRYKDTWPLCLDFLRSGKIDVKPLITHRFGFSQGEVEEAFQVSARGRDAIKVMFNL